jgi:hypothetical protein
MEDEKIELNLENPIFAIYINVENMPSSRAIEFIENTKRSFDIYSNVTTWIISSNVSKVECIYDGKSKIRIDELNNLIKELNDRINILSESNNYEDFKINIRDWRLNKVFE